MGVKRLGNLATRVELNQSSPGCPVWMPALGLDNPRISNFQNFIFDINGILYYKYVNQQNTRYEIHIKLPHNYMYTTFKGLWALFGFTTQRFVAI